MIEVSRWSDERGAVEPLVALAAVLVVGVLLSMYAVGVDRTLPGDRERDLAEPTLRAVVDDATHNGVVRPARLTAGRVAPDGHRVRVELRAAGRTWTDGPAAPRDAETAVRQVSVRVGSDVEPGRLRVEVWVP